MIRTGLGLDSMV